MEQVKPTIKEQKEEFREKCEPDMDTVNTAIHKSDEKNSDKHKNNNHSVIYL